MSVLVFLSHYWLDIFVYLILFFLITTKILPPRLAGLEESFTDERGNVKTQSKQSILDAVGNALFFTFFRSLIAVLTVKGTTTLIIFAVIVVELINSKTISDNSVVLTIVAITALYIDYIFSTAEEITVGKVLTYKKKK